MGDELMISVVIPAAGSSSRMKSDQKKQHMMLRDKPIMVDTVEVFENSDSIDEIILVVPEDEIEWIKREYVEPYSLKKVAQVIAGGANRQESVYNGLQAVDVTADYVLIHDAVRPFVSEAIVERVVRSLSVNDAVTVGVRVKDTVKVVDEENNVVNTLDRSSLISIQTPQAFKLSIIKEAHEKLKGLNATDDTMLVEKLGNAKVKVIEGSYNNIKVTTQEDLLHARVILDSEFSRQ